MVYLKKVKTEAEYQTYLEEFRLQYGYDKPLVTYITGSNIVKFDNIVRKKSFSLAFDPNSFNTVSATA